MARGGKDYMVGGDKEDEYLPANGETGGFEEECVENKIKKVGRPRGQKSCQRRSGAVKPRNKTGVSSSKKSGGDRCNKKPRKKARVSYQEKNEDSDVDYSDEEFAPDEVDFMDDDEESPRMKGKKVSVSNMQEAHTTKGKKRKRNFKASKRTSKKKTAKKPTLRRKSKESVSKRSTKNGRGSRKVDESSKLKSGYSDYEHTISEEEREQIREASEFCGRLTTNLQSSSSLKTFEEKKTVPSERKCAGAKNKEKMVDLKVEVGKQICGICLSEEGKRSVRGILNCCSHYFCFACIMEWSKVESRCPLCKQRFTTISRTKQLDGGINLKDEVIPVPKCDQVYQPSEDELRGYIDPYANVLCTECHQGGDDALMLLCDLCDSSAHTYCVGLGRVVPDGNWYCDGCRPAVVASSAQAPNPTPSGGENNNLAVGENLDLNKVDVPETPMSGESGHLQAAFGSGAFTLDVRRRIQQHVHHLLRNYRSRQSERSDGMDPLSVTSVPGSQNISSVVTPRDTASLLCGREVPQPRSTSSTRQVVHHQASTSTDGPSRTGLSATTARMTGHNLGDQYLRSGNRVSNTGGSAKMSTSPEKEHVQSMVRSHLKSLSRNMDIDYNTFKCIARTCTHTILAAVGLEHRWNEVFPTQMRPLVCDHFDDIGSEQIYPIGGQCSPCFDWFIRNVVREVMSARRPPLSRD